MPLLFMVGCWMLLLRPEKVKEYFPPLLLPLLGMSKVFNLSWSKLLPIMPTDMMQSFDMGGILEKISSAEETKNQSAINSCL